MGGAAAAAVAYLSALGGLLGAQLETERDAMHEKRLEEVRVLAATYEERMENTAAKSIEDLRLQFEEVTKRNGLHGNSELAGELAEMITRPGGVSLQLVANTYQLDDDDAAVLLSWAQKACAMRDEIGYQSMNAI